MPPRSTIFREDKALNRSEHEVEDINSPGMFDFWLVNHTEHLGLLLFKSTFQKTHFCYILEAFLMTYFVVCWFACLPQTEKDLNGTSEAHTSNLNKKKPQQFNFSNDPNFSVSLIIDKSDSRIMLQFPGTSSWKIYFSVSGNKKLFQKRLALLECLFIQSSSLHSSSSILPGFKLKNHSL